MLALGESDHEPGVADAVARATEWLAGQQSDEGAFTGSGDTAVENSQQHRARGLGARGERPEGRGRERGYVGALGAGRQ